MKLLIINTNNQQEIIEVGEGGGYFDSSKVLWDERVDGLLPNITLGGMERINGSLIFSQVVYDSHTTNELAIRKLDKLKALKDKFNSIDTSKPRVATGLGYDVDGGRDNKDDFFSKWESMVDIDVTTVRDADNAFHPNTTKAQMQTIYRAIVANGELLLQWKWQKEIEIANCTTLAELDAVVF